MSAEWRGRFLEDFAVGDVYRSRLGRTVSEADNTWFTCLTMNTNQMHFNREYAARTEFGQPLVVSTLTLAIVLGLSVADTSENAVANLGWGDIKLPKPGLRRRHALGRERGVGVRESRSRPSCGIVSIRTRGINQRARGRDRVHAELHGLQADAPEVADAFPATDEPWTVGEEGLGARAIDGRRRDRRAPAGSRVTAVGESAPGSISVCSTGGTNQAGSAAAGSAVGSGMSPGDVVAAPVGARRGQSISATSTQGADRHRRDRGGLANLAIAAAGRGRCGEEEHLEQEARR